MALLVENNYPEHFSSLAVLQIRKAIKIGFKASLFYWILILWHLVFVGDSGSPVPVMAAASGTPAKICKQKRPDSPVFAAAVVFSGDHESLDPRCFFSSRTGSSPISATGSRNPLISQIWIQTDRVLLCRSGNRPEQDRSAWPTLDQHLISSIDRAQL